MRLCVCVFVCLWRSKKHISCKRKPTFSELPRRGFPRPDITNLRSVLLGILLVSQKPIEIEFFKNSQREVRDGFFGSEITNPKSVLLGILLVSQIPIEIEF